MTNSSDPKMSSKGPPLCGGPDLVRDSDGFMRRELPEAARKAIAFKEAYVLEIIKAQGDPRFSLSEGYLQAFIKRVSQRFGTSAQSGAIIRSSLPPPRALRRWHQKYVAADYDPLALLPGRPRPNRAKAPSED